MQCNTLLFSSTFRFGEESMDRVIRWMTAQNIPQNASVLDIGTGNGMFLVELASQNFSVSLCNDFIHII